MSDLRGCSSSTQFWTISTRFLSPSSAYKLQCTWSNTLMDWFTLVLTPFFICEHVKRLPSTQWLPSPKTSVLKPIQTCKGQQCLWHSEKPNYKVPKEVPFYIFSTWCVWPTVSSEPPPTLLSHWKTFMCWFPIDVWLCFLFLLFSSVSIFSCPCHWVD